MIERLTRSLSFRLLAIFLLLAAVFIYGATEAIRWVYTEDDLRELISGHLSLHVDYVRRDIGNPPRVERAMAITEQVPVDIRISGDDVNWASDPDFPEESELQFGASNIFSEEPGALLDALTDVEFALQGHHRFLKIREGNFDIIVSSPRISDRQLGPNFVSIIVVIGLVWLLFAYLSVRWLFRPIDSIREGAARIGRGDFAHRIQDSRRDQLGDLAQDVNRLAADVRDMLDAKRQLLLGISHELRSPLSRLRLALEFLKDDENRENLRIEIAEMEQIISTLLEAERLNERHVKLNVTAVPLKDLVEQLIDDFFARDAERINTIFEDESVVANVDDVRLILLLKNLLNNALRYSPAAAGPVTVDISAKRHDLIIRVLDHGPGFSADQRSKVGEAFFRGDPSRTRETGGSGLGLYIVRLIAEAHGGQLKLDENYQDGACMVVTFPDCIN